MSWRNVTELGPGVYWVGIRDWNRRLFDALIPLPRGTTYNSYLVIGSSKRALIDTANPGFEKELEEKIRQITDPAKIDYLIMNHAEPDHAGSIPYIMNLNKQVKLVTSTQGARMAKRFYNVPEERVMSVRDQETISLGDKTLRFIEAPMLHWPETMFTYLQEDNVLFPCDFFGSHMAGGVYADEVDDILVHAQRYFGEIMMPFRSMGQKAIEKIKGLELKTIAPSHGPIHRKPGIILNAYKKWVNGETKRKVIVVYTTMWQNTDKMIKPVIETLAANGIEIAVHNLTVSDIGDIATDLVDSEAIVLGAPTVLGGAHPLAVYATYLMKALRPPVKFGLVLSSYGWSGGAIKNIQDILGPMKIELLGAMEINGPPSEDDNRKIIELATTLAMRIRED